MPVADVPVEVVGRGTHGKLPGNGKLLVESRPDATILTFDGSTVLQHGIYLDLNDKTFTIPGIGTTGALGVAQRHKNPHLGHMIEFEWTVYEKMFSEFSRKETVKSGAIELTRMNSRRGECAMSFQFHRTVHGVLLDDEDFVLKFSCPTRDVAVRRSESAESRRLGGLKSRGVPYQSASTPH